MTSRPVSPAGGERPDASVENASPTSGSAASSWRVPQLGRLVPPYPVDHCANVDCERPLVTAEDAAYLYKDQDTGKLVVFCEDCSAHVELVAPVRFKLVAL